MWVNQLVLLITQHTEDLLRHGGYWVIAIVSAVEALPLLGSIIPGHTVVILGGFFARLEILNIYWVMAAAAFGASCSRPVRRTLRLRLRFRLHVRAAT